MHKSPRVSFHAILGLLKINGRISVSRVGLLLVVVRVGVGWEGGVGVGEGDCQRI